MDKWEALGRLRLLEWAVGRFLLFAFFVGGGMSALVSFIQELSLLNGVIISIAVGAGSAILVAVVSRVWRLWTRGHEDRSRKLTTQLEDEIPSEKIETTDSFLIEHQDQLRDVIQEENNLVFFRKIQRLYPLFQNQGVQMLKVRPFIIESDRYRNYHVGLLKDLDLQITRIVHDEISLDLDQWSQTVSLREKNRDVLVREDEPVALLDEMELQVLRLIYDQLRDCKVVTMSMVYTHQPFLNISPGVPYKAVVHLTCEGYIDASEDESGNPFAPASARPWTIRRVTEKGRRALREGKSE